MYRGPKQYLKLDKRLRELPDHYSQRSILKSTRQKNWLLNPICTKQVTFQFTPNVVRNLTKKGTAMAKTDRKIGYQFPAIQNKLHFSSKYQRKQATVVGIQTAALLVTYWISYGNPARNKRAGYSFEFLLSITLTVI